MKTEREVKDMIDHFERDANDKEESAERQNMYKDMVKALRMVVDGNMKSEQEVKDMITNSKDQVMINAFQMVLD
jgi:hypothetical protein